MFADLIDLFKKDNLLNEAINESFLMLEISEQMYNDSYVALREKKYSEIATQIYEQDIKINKFERAVRKKVFNHLSESGGKDLSAGLVLITIITDIERIGDYVKNIFELTQYYPTKLEAGKFEEDIQRIELSIKDMFGLIRETLADSDVEKARNIMNDYFWIIKRCDSINQFIISNNDCVLSANNAVSLTLYIRYLKRIAAHIINVATSVVNPFYRIGYKEKEK